MGLIPKKTKFRKQQRNRMKGCATAGNTIVFGEYGLMSLESLWLKTNQIESARKAITHYLKRGGRVWIRCCADKPYTARAAETRMGSGKGDPVGYAACIKPGHIVFELGGVQPDLAHEALKRAAHKLPFRSKIVVKE